MRGWVGRSFCCAISDSIVALRSTDWREQVPEFVVTYYRTNRRHAMTLRVEADDIDAAAADAVNRCNAVWFVGRVEQADLPEIEPEPGPIFALYPGDG